MSSPKTWPEARIERAGVKKDWIVVGASAGGVEAVSLFLRNLPADLPAAIFVVIHLSPFHASNLPRVLETAGPFPASTPRDGRRIEPGKVYVAPPNRHLLIEGDRVRVLKGPTENFHRPAIDPLFRSAAFYGRSRVAGVLLTGADTDGTAGLFSVKLRGGTTIIQDPDEAHAPAMPGSALKHVKIDYVLPLRQIPPLVVELARGRTRIRRLGGGRIPCDLRG
jgi:two-component system chemotaxis response regulator CheB